MTLLRTRSASIDTRPLRIVPSARHENSYEPSNAPHGNVEGRCFQITHPYHPLFKREFEAVTFRQNWGEDRVWFYDNEGRLQSVPTSWTDAAPMDVLVVVAAGRSLFRVADLLELTQRIQTSSPEQPEESVKEKMS